MVTAWLGLAWLGLAKYLYPSPLIMVIMVRAMALRTSLVGEGFAGVIMRLTPSGCLA
jgi:hypothetical protein